MLDKEMNEQLMNFELKIKDVFIERNASKLKGKDLSEVIAAYIKWRHNRYTVMEEGKCFMVMDMYKQELPVAIIGKDLDPDAFNHAWSLAEDLNNLPEEYLSIGNQVLPMDNFDFSHTESSQLSPMPNPASVAAAIKKTEKMMDAEEKEDE